MSKLRSVKRRFPDYGWAWPRGDHDRLLKAVMMSHEGDALDIALHWLASHDIDDVQFREQRLLAALCDRFGKKLAASRAYPRLAGLQRMLWSRSQMALRDSAEALSTLACLKIPFMLLKGASRVATEPGAQRGRVSHDIDILLKPADMRAAFAALLGSGWQAASGAGPMRLMDQAANCRAMNFHKGEFGDIDIHSMAYQPVHASVVDSEALWQRAMPARLAQIAALVPSPADRIALAIAHGALDAHVHSDWLVDIDRCIRSGGIDWEVLLGILKARHVLIPAASALSYLQQEIGTPVPAPILVHLLDHADRQGIKARLALLECKPRTDFNTVVSVARGVAKQLRIRKGKATQRPAKEIIWRASRARNADKNTIAGSATTASIAVKPRSSSRIKIVIEIDLPSLRRRMDWELASDTRHVAVLRYRNLFSQAGRRELSFSGDIVLGEGEDALVLTARPTRSLRSSRDPGEIERHGAIPFRIVRLSGPAFHADRS